MKNSNKFLLNSLALAIISASASHAFAQTADLKSVDKIENAKSNAPSFAQWQEQEKLNKYDYTDQLIIQFKDKNQ